jgi:hypothetical protein
MQNLPDAKVELELKGCGVTAWRLRQLDAERVFAHRLDGAPFHPQEVKEIAGERRVAHSDVQCRRRLPGVAATGLLHSLWEDS